MPSEILLTFARVLIARVFIVIGGFLLLAGLDMKQRNQGR